MAGIDLRCKAPSCESFVLHVRHSRKTPYGDSRIVGVNGNSMLIECGACHSVSSWYVKKPKEDPAVWARSGKVDVLPGTSYQLERDIVPLMEERWSAFSKAKLRERGNVASGLRFNVFMRDDFRCRYCGRSAEDGAILHADHVVPQSKGGPTTLENLVTACFDCNIGKSNKDLQVAASVIR